jgi:hypothetical protein
MNENPFPKFGIEHLSPSSCNQWAASPAAFILQRLMNHSVPVGAAAHRGNSVEAGIIHGLLDPQASVSDCIGIAMEKFRTLTAMSIDPRLPKETDSIAGFVEQGLTELRPYGIPSSTQGKVEYFVPGLHVPLIGFYDIEWAATNIIVDIKTTHALPSKITSAHARQVALYSASRGNAAGRISYVTSKKAATYGLENVAEHVKALGQVALTIQKFLSISEDPLELASMISPDVDSFYFADAITRKAVYDIWGI